MKQYSTTAGLYRGLLYNLVKSGKKSSIALTSSETYENRVIDNIIDFDHSNLFTSTSNSEYGQWAQVELKDRYIDLYAYALGFDGENYPRSWDILVSTDGKEWITPDVVRNCDDAYYGHIFKFSKHIGFIRFLKIINRGMNGIATNSNTRLYLTNVDIYGNTIKCITNCTIFPHFIETKANIRVIGITPLSLYSFLFLVY